MICNIWVCPIFSVTKNELKPIFGKQTKKQKQKNTFSQ
jgi:hypothetical protein